MTSVARSGLHACRPQKTRSSTPETSVTSTGEPSSPFVGGYPRTSGKSSRGRRPAAGFGGTVGDTVGDAEGVGVGEVVGVALSDATGAEVA
jgi:hypothetical protein